MGGGVFSNKLKMACARDLKALIVFELMGGKFVGCLIAARTFRQFASV
jgi:hypothetical protein